MRGDDIAQDNAGAEHDTVVGRDRFSRFGRSPSTRLFNDGVVTIADIVDVAIAAAASRQDIVTRAAGQRIAEIGAVDGIVTASGRAARTSEQVRSRPDGAIRKLHLLDAAPSGQLLLV